MNKPFNMKKNLIICVALLIGIFSFGLCLLSGLNNGNFNHTLDVRLEQNYSNEQGQIEGENYSKTNEFGEQGNAYDIPIVGAGEKITIMAYYEERNDGYGGVSNPGITGGTLSKTQTGAKTQRIELEKTASAQSIYAFKKDGYELKKVYYSTNFVDGEGFAPSSMSGIYKITINNPPSNNIYVYFTLIRYDVNITYLPENFSVSYQRDGRSFFYDDEVTISCVELNTQYIFDSWQEYVGGNLVFKSTQKTFKFNIRSARTFFLVPKVLIQLEQPEIGGSIYVENESGTKIRNEYYASFNEELKFVAEPSSGYEFLSWTSIELFNRAYVANISVGGPIFTTAEFVSKRCEIAITSTDMVNGNISASTDTTSRLYNIGEIITLTVNIAPNYKFNGWETNASGSFNRSYTGEQNYTITASDVQKHDIYFRAVVKKIKAHASITVFGGGEIDINNNGKTTSLEQNATVGQTYKIDFYPFNMFKITDIIYYDVNTDTERHLLNTDIMENMQTIITVDDDFELRIYFGVLTWMDERIEPQGEGTSENPYLISCPEELAFIAYAVNNDIVPEDSGKVAYKFAYFKIMSNLDLKGNHWTQIGDMSHTFQGTLDANFKTIHNIILEDGSTNHNYISLFGGKTRNVKIIRELQTLWRVFFISVSFILLTLIIIIAINMNKRKEKIKKVIILDKELLNKNYK